MRTAFLILVGIAIGVAVSLPFHSRDGAPTPQSAADENSLAERELERVIPKVDIEDLPFDRAVAEIQKLTTAEITVDWKAMADAGFDRKWPVVLHASDVRLFDVLDRLTREGFESGPIPIAGFQPVSGRIAILPNAQTQQRAIERVYDVRDLIAAGPGSPGGELSGGGTASEKIEQLQTVLINTINPESWRDNGGVFGRIDQFGGHFLISQDWHSHREIQDILRQLRSAPAPPIVESTSSGVHQWWISPEMSGTFEALLQKPIDQIEFDNVSLDQAIDRLQTLSGVPLSINWGTLSRAKFPRQACVSLRTKGASLSSALQTLFNRPIDGLLLGFAVEDGCAIISAKDETDQFLTIRLYDIRDLMEKRRPGETLGESVGDLVNLIMQNVAPESWWDQGGKIGKISVLQGCFAVTQTWANQEKVAAILDTMRKNRITLYSEPFMKE